MSIDYPYQVDLASECQLPARHRNEPGGGEVMGAAFGDDCPWNGASVGLPNDEVTA